MKRKRLILLWLWIPVFALLMSSCRDSDEEERNFEKKLIQSYLSENDIDVEPTSSGLYYIQEEEGTGESPQTADFVKIDYTWRMVQDELLLSTTDSALAQEEDDYFQYHLYGPEYFQVGTLIDGLNEGLMMMKEGGKAKLLIPSDLAWGSSSNGPVPPYTPVMIDVELLEVISDLADRERNLLNDYLESKNIDPADSTDRGIYKIILEEGTGDTIKSQDRIATSFKGWLSDGREFVEYDSVRWDVNRTETSILTPGLQLAVQGMLEGEKSILIVPYYLGYGSRTVTYYEGKRKAPIPPYSMLYYEMEVLNIPDSTDTQ